MSDFGGVGIGLRELAVVAGIFLLIGGLLGYGCARIPYRLHVSVERTP